MKWRLFFLLATIGCAKSLPVEIHLDKTFSAEDRAIVLEAVAQWNELASPLLRDPKDIFVVGDDIETFTGLPELGDDLHGIYHADYKKFTPPYVKTGDAFGYTTLNDTLLYSDFIRQTFAEIIVVDEEINRRDPGRHARIVHHGIKKVAIHELGHMLGLMHYFHRDGLMVPGVPQSVTTIEGPRLSDADLEAFCIMYDCPDASFKN